jgi:hypothetical protein
MVAETAAVSKKSAATWPRRRAALS